MRMWVFISDAFLLPGGEMTSNSFKMAAVKIKSSISASRSPIQRLAPDSKQEIKNIWIKAMNTYRVLIHKIK